MPISMNPRGRDVHRVYVIGYRDGSTLVANTRDESTLGAWVLAELGLAGIDRRGIYRRENGAWVFDHSIGEPINRPFREKAQAKITPDRSQEAREAVKAALAAASGPGLLSGELLARFLGRESGWSKRTLYRILRDFERVGIVTREREPGNRKRYRLNVHHQASSRSAPTQ